MQRKPPLNCTNPGLTLADRLTSSPTKFNCTNPKTRGLLALYNSARRISWSAAGQVMLMLLPSLPGSPSALSLRLSIWRGQIFPRCSAAWCCGTNILGQEIGKPRRKCGVWKIKLKIWSLCAISAPFCQIYPKSPRWCAMNFTSWFIMSKYPELFPLSSVHWPTGI